jgi:hypothetical protein
MLHLSTRQEIDKLTGSTSTQDAIEFEAIAMVAHDTYEQTGSAEKAREIVAMIPPIKLGRTTYRVVCGARGCYTIVGPRGGSSSLVESRNYPGQWAHTTMSGWRGRSVWYRREADGTFTAI